MPSCWPRSRGRRSRIMSWRRRCCSRMAARSRRGTLYAFIEISTTVRSKVRRALSSLSRSVTRASRSVRRDRLFGWGMAFLLSTERLIPHPGGEGKRKQLIPIITGSRVRKVDETPRPCAHVRSVCIAKVSRWNGNRRTSTLIEIKRTSTPAAVSVLSGLCPF